MVVWVVSYSEGRVVMMMGLVASVMKMRMVVFDILARNGINYSPLPAFSTSIVCLSSKSIRHTHQPPSSPASSNVCATSVDLPSFQLHLKKDSKLLACYFHHILSHPLLSKFLSASEAIVNFALQKCELPGMWYIRAPFAHRHVQYACLYFSFPV